MKGKFINGKIGVRHFMFPRIQFVHQSAFVPLNLFSKSIHCSNKSDKEIYTIYIGIICIKTKINPNGMVAKKKTLITIEGEK